MCPEVKGDITGEKCKETFTIIVLGGRSGEEIGFYGGEEFRIAKPSLLFSKTTSGNTKAFLKGAEHQSMQQLGLPMTRASQVQVFSLN